MNTLRNTLLAASMVALFGAAQAQSTTGDTTQRDAATSTGTSTSQQEMNRGVPGVDVDAGRNARGAMDASVDRKTDASNMTRDSERSDAMASDTRRAPRADRN